MREPFPKLIEEYANNFFSKPVLCTMSERIGSHSLNRTDKHCMEKDVFQSDEYRLHVKEKNDNEDKKEEEKKDR